MDYTTYLVDKYWRKGIIIDTNLMLVYIVGMYNPNYVGQFHKTEDYCREDYDYIYSVLSHFSKVIITPHILAELSNLSPKIQDNKQDKKLLEYFNVFKDVLERTSERYIKKDDILNFPLLPKFGITDLAIIEAAKRYNYLVFTNDSSMVGCMRNMDMEVLYLNDIRTALWMKK